MVIIFHDFYDPVEGYKNVSAIIFNHLPNQELLEHPQRHPLIAHKQKPYQIRLENTTGRDYPGLVEFNLINTYFYSE